MYKHALDIEGPLTDSRQTCGFRRAEDGIEIAFGYEIRLLNGHLRLDGETCGNRTNKSEIVDVYVF